MCGNTVIKGRIYDIQGFSVQDGPGIRTTVFLKGCPLSCLWCHSPESQKFGPELNWMEMKCVGISDCGLCMDACPEKCITPGNYSERFNMSGKKDAPVQLIKIDANSCVDCLKCADACPSKALYLCGEEYSVEEIMEKVRRDKPFFGADGGVTISGGECLCQPEFTRELLIQCKNAGVNTAVDTTGFVKWEIIESVLPYTDLFLYDLKCMDSEMHKKVTGVPNELILENALKISKAGGKFQIRIPTIPGINETEESFDKFGKFICELGDSVEVVQILPYHNLGLVKWNRLLRDSNGFEVTPPDDELINKRKEQLEKMGLNVTIH